MQGYKEENAGIFKCKDIRERMQVYLNARI